MAFCRWSCLDYQCDLYIYEDSMGGYTTHVAGNRVVFKEPLPEAVPFEPNRFTEWFARHQKVMRMVGEADRKPIELPHAGETFGDDTLEQLRDRLLYLQGVGYLFPDYVLPDIEEEIAGQAGHE